MPRSRSATAPRKPNSPRTTRARKSAPVTAEVIALPESVETAAVPALEPGLSVEAAQRMEAVPLTDEDSISAPLPAGYPYLTRMRRSEYEAEKKKLQIELLKVQSWVKASGQRVIILFEGRDAAGKGGAIKRFTEHLNPRGARVVALEKPNDQERGQWYFQRYIEHLPTAGELVFFDRSWYNRAGVERVMDFCSPAEYIGVPPRGARIRAHARP